ncbi:MAG: hypothetical protein MJB57_08395 [Gemmatimonadetes bacterium]|nr:hypothetical protein [Gemmatimonadota bacterium]
MSRTADGGRETKERDERDARFFAWDVPGDAQVVALVHESEDAERSATVVDAIATSIARRREHTLVLSAEPASPLDELLGGSESEGLPAALGGRARLTDVAIQRVDRPFVYLPAGNDGAAMRSLLDDEALVSFVDRVRERGGTLFVVVSDDTILSDGLRKLLDGYVALGEVSVPNGERGLMAFGRVRFEGPDESLVSLSTANGAGAASPPIPPERSSGSDPESSPFTLELAAPARRKRSRGKTERSSGPANATRKEDERTKPAAPEPEEEKTSGDFELLPPTNGVDQLAKKVVEAEEGPARWSRHRKGGGFPALQTGIGAAIIAGLVAAWWWYATNSEGPASAEAPASEAVRSATPPPVATADATRAFAEAPELPYSVLIASHADKGDADRALEEIRADGAAGIFFLSPTPVRGVIYHRLFAGAHSTEPEAVSLMERLVADGHKAEASAWDVRPARSAFDLGVFATRDDAERRVSSLEEAGIPSYIVSAPLEDRDVYQVYGGAYENERASLPMAELLGAVGEPATLIARQGGAPPPSSTP